MSELHFDLTGTTPVSPFSLSFDVDTHSGRQSIGFGDSCLKDAIANGAVFSNVSMNGQALTALPGYYALDAVTNGCSGPLYYQLYAPSLFLWTSDSPGASQAALSASADPMAALLKDINDGPGNSVYLLGARETAQISHVAVSVPEPGTLVLLAWGLAVILGLRKFRHS
jgi:PEP-CTERM motif